ncbi:MAG: YchF/TatD family DNA exonuclease [Deltaproteobacteria bacterium]|nr:YchF/TatD family DNA exonuclease [Deltaproteobacteria bacterium]
MPNHSKLIDTHAHLDDPGFNKDRDETVKKAREAGLKYIITVGCWGKKGFKPTLVVADRYDLVYATLGVHPHDAKGAKEDTFVSIQELASHPKVIAIGETGLDYHYDRSPREVQKEVFRRHILLARQLNLPLVIHSREAQKDTLDILKEEGAQTIGGVFHCFSGGYEMARICLDMGFYLSFTGVVTFANARGILDVVKKTPIERMLVETDCPYLTPEAYRGKRNEPAYVVEVARRIAELKGLSFDDVARVTSLSAIDLFGLEGGEREVRIAYPIRNSLYLNITNRCTNYCTFCTKFRSYTVKGHYLRLKEEPDFNDVIMAVGDEPTRYNEIVFCGFGEPLIRLDLVKQVGMFLKKRGCKIRIDTDGLANLVHGRNVLPELMFVDVISVSMNAPDSLEYQRLVKTPFGDKAFPAILWFLREAKRYIPKVIATVVALPGLDIEACRRVAEDEIGVPLRVRGYDEVG